MIKQKNFISEKSSINIRMNVTNQHIAFTLQLKFVEAFEKFTKQLVSWKIHEIKMFYTWISSFMKTLLFQFRTCEIPEGIANLPLIFDSPIYGNLELTFTDFMAPGIILTIGNDMNSLIN